MKGRVLVYVSRDNVIYGVEYSVSFLLLLRLMEDRFVRYITYVLRVYSALFVNIIDTVESVEVLYINSVSVFGAMIVAVY